MLNVKDVVLIYLLRNVEMLMIIVDPPLKSRWPQLFGHRQFVALLVLVFLLEFEYSTNAGASLKKVAWGRRQPQPHQPWEWLCSLWLWPSWVSRNISFKRAFVFVVKYQHKCVKLRKSLRHTENLDPKYIEFWIWYHISYFILCSKVEVFIIKCTSVSSMNDFSWAVSSSQ